jgi:hypothetical protein
MRRYVTQTNLVSIQSVIVIQKLGSIHYVHITYYYSFYSKLSVTLAFLDA